MTPFISILVVLLMSIKPQALRLTVQYKNNTRKQVCESVSWLRTTRTQVIQEVLVYSVDADVVQVAIHCDSSHDSS